MAASLLGVAAWLAVHTLTAAERSRLPRGTDVLHFFIRKDFTPAEGVTNVDGRLEIKQNAQGAANNQRLDLVLRQLEPHQTYHLLAWLGDDTEATYVAAVTSDDIGQLVLRYRRQATGNGQGLGHGRLPLPDVLDPVHQIRRLDVANASTQTVASADTALPERFHYLVRRRLTNEGVDADAQALVRLKANPEHARLELFAIGLDSQASYSVAINGEAYAPLLTDDLGRAYFELYPDPSVQAFAIHELAIWDSGNQVVLRTELP